MLRQEMGAAAIGFARAALILERGFDVSPLLFTLMSLLWLEGS